MTQLSSFAHDRGEANPRTDAGPTSGTISAAVLRRTGPRTPGNESGDMPERFGREWSFTHQPRPDESLLDIFRRLEVVLKASDAAILKLMIYGPVKMAAPATEAMQRVFGTVNWPVTWVEGLSCNGAPIAGLQAFAFNGDHVNRLHLDGRVVGSVFEDGDARYCFVGGLGPDNVAGSRIEQTERTLDRLQEVLAQANFSLGDVVRTWFFLDDLLSWYDAFNEVRARVYSRMKFRLGSFPASTGVAGRNPTGAALTVGAWAMQSLKPQAQVAEVLSPLQCPACAYGSRFSRAVEVQSGGIRRLLVSGTASIDPNGQTAHVGDVRSQIRLSMQVVEAILESRGMSFADVTRATAYFKSPADAPAFADWCEQRELRKLPAVSTGCDICRPDLLFEVELDAEVRCGQLKTQN